MDATSGKDLEVLDDFLNWCNRHKISLSRKIKVTSTSTSHRYGIIANEDIRCSETLVEIPRNIALTPSQSSIASRLKEFKDRNVERLQQTSGWISLLLALMYEMKKGDSYWAPYLALCPSINEFNQPMFWNEDERQEELAGMSLLWDVQRDLYNIEKEYQQFAIPFIESNQDILSKGCHDLNLYKHMVGFVMSYSFTDYENGETMMVPIADLFNHHTNNNAQLSFDDESHLKMISTKPIKKGEEVFNTFGKLGNSHLLHMYGFVEKHQNPNDSVEISLTQIVDVLEATDADKLPVFQAMLAFMRKMGIADEKDQFAFCLSGLKSGPDMYAVLRILHMDFKEFTGLLQDHVSWYQDQYFLFLLEHMHQATNRAQNGEEDLMQVKNEDSDDDVVIVKEVKSSSRKINVGKSDAEPVKEEISKDQVVNRPKTGEVKEESKQAEKNETEQETKQENTERKGIKNKASGIHADEKIVNAKEQEKISSRNEDSMSLNNKNDVVSEAVAISSKSDQNKKSSPQSDGSRKSKTRKRKPAKPVHDSDDSDEEVKYKANKKQFKKDNQIAPADNGNINDSIERNTKDKKLEDIVKGAGIAKEDTAKWVLQLPSIDGEHSEDPDDESDYDDNETQLQLTYDQISSILPPSWKVTMRSVVTNALEQMKKDPTKVNSNEKSEHEVLAYQLRLGQKRILQIIKKSLAT